MCGCVCESVGECVCVCERDDSQWVVVCMTCGVYDMRCVWHDSLRCAGVDSQVWVGGIAKWQVAPATVSHCNMLQRTATHRNTLHELQHTHAKWYVAPATVSHYNTLQHTATHCNVLRHTAAHCSTHLQDDTRLLQRCHTTLHCNTLQRIATHCSTLYHTLAKWQVAPTQVSRYTTLQHTATHYNMLQHTAALCSTHIAKWHMAPAKVSHYTILHHPAPHCNTLQHAAAHCSTHSQNDDWLIRGCVFVQKSHARTQKRLTHKIPCGVTWRLYVSYVVFTWPAASVIIRGIAMYHVI